MVLEFHPAANLFPLLDSASREFTDLVEDIRVNGQIEPIKLFDGKILDGRNRYRACVEADIEPKTVPWSGDSPVAYVLSANLHRRHLTDDQRAAIAVETLPMLEAEAEVRRREKISTSRSGESETVENSPPSQLSRQQAAEQFKVSEHKVRQAKVVAADSELLEEVKTGKTSLKDAEKKVRTSKRPMPTSSMPPGMVVKPPRPPREQPALANRLYKTVQAFPDKAVTTALAEEIQTANLDLPEDAIRKLTDHLKQVNSGRLALVRGLESLATVQGNSTS